jgi:hypothetical protein
MKDAGVDGDKSFETYGMKSRQYTWTGRETLVELLEKKDEILVRHQERIAREASQKQHINRPLWELLANALDQESQEQQCTICAI